jgi:hypothetical protein
VKFCTVNDHSTPFNRVDIISTVSILQDEELSIAYGEGFWHSSEWPRSTLLMAQRAYGSYSTASKRKWEKILSDKLITSSPVDKSPQYNGPISSTMENDEAQNQYSSLPNSPHNSPAEVASYSTPLIPTYTHQGEGYVDNSAFTHPSKSPPVSADIGVGTWNMDGRILVTANALLSSIAVLFKHYAMDVLCLQDIRIHPAQESFLKASIIALKLPWNIVLRCASKGAKVHMGGTLVLVSDEYIRYMIDAIVEESGLALLVHLRFRIKGSNMSVISAYILPQCVTKGVDTLHSRLKNFWDLVPFLVILLQECIYCRY